MKYIELICAEILEKVEKLGISIRGVIEDQYSTDPIVRKFRSTILALCLEVVRKYVLLDEISRYVLGKLPKNLYQRYVLRTVTYELKFRNISIERLEKVCHKARLKISRRDLENIKNIDIESVVGNRSIEEKLHIVHSIPLWLVKYILSRFEDGIKIIESFSQKLPIYVRVRGSRDEVLKILDELGFNPYPDPDFKDVIALDRCRVEVLEKNLKNLVYIQDKSSILVGHVIERVCPKCRSVLDTCSAPGGKAIHVSDLLNCYVVGVDVSYRRLLTELRLIYRYCRDFNIDIVCSSILKPCIKYRRFDLILVDPDCSSIGKICHSPEIKLWLREHHIKHFSNIQFKILKRVCENFDRNTVLVYSTCTITFEENEDVIKKLCDYYGFEILDLCELFPKFCNRYLRGSLRLFPHLHKTGGHFVACLRG